MKKWYSILLVLSLVGMILLAAGCSKRTTTTTTTSTTTSGAPHITLKLADGTIYQTTVGNTPFEFTLGTHSVIVGFETAVNGMTVGETKTVTIPAAQAYGAQPNASNPLAGKDLTFVITLLQIE
jgi:FKBP-type peptidyl-prolyl cis-trans isomerase